MSYLVKYVSECGTENDNEIIGTFSSFEEAKREKVRYISQQIGSLEDFCKNDNDFSNENILEYIDSIKYYYNQVGILK